MRETASDGFPMPRTTSDCEPPQFEIVARGPASEGVACKDASPGVVCSSPESVLSRRSSKKRHSVAKDTYSAVLQEVGGDYPMLCFCEPHNHCRFKPTGHMGALPWRKKLSFGLPFAGYYAASYLKRTTMKPFYTDDYPAASLGYIAFFSTLGVLIDAFTDPAMANLTDNSRPRWGRRRPYIVFGGILGVLVWTLGFMPVVPAGIASSLWFGVFHIGTKLVDTAWMIPLDAWGAEMTPNVNERSELWMCREIFVVIGIMLGAVAPGFLSELGGVNCTETPDTGCIGYPVAGFLFALFCLGGTLLLVLNSKERPNDRLPVQEKQGIFDENATVPTLISTWLNRPFKCLIASDLAEAFGGNLPFVVLPYFARVVLGDACMKPAVMMSLLAGLNLVFRMIALPVWVWAGRYFGKFNTYVAYNFILAASHVLFVLSERDDSDCSQLPLTCVIAIIWGMAYGGNFFLKSIMSDVADYDEFLTGKRREGQYMMTLEFLPKFLEVPAEAMPFLLMAYLDYKRPSGDGTLPVQPEAVVWLIRMCISIVPAVFICMGACVLLCYPKPARGIEAHRQIVVAIRDAHRKGQPAEDPWFPGNWVDPPTRPQPNDHVLAYFWQEDMKAALQAEGDNVNYAALQRRTFRGVGVGAVLIPIGVWLMVWGWEDMGSDLGASVSPIGLIFVGLAILSFWFDGTRYRAAREMANRQIPRAEIHARYNFLCRFTGGELLPSEGEDDGGSDVEVVTIGSGEAVTAAGEPVLGDAIE